MLQFSPFNLFVIVMITILMIFFIIFVIKKLNPTSRSKKRLKVIKKYKNFDSINILEDKVGEKEDFVISKDEIYTFLAEVSRISLLGVENIVLTSRPKQLFKVFSGAYRPYQSYRSNEGSTIFLYPFEKEDDLYRYYFGYKDKRNNEDVNDLDNDHYEEYYLLISKEQAKKEQLFTLGHELGHSTIYNVKEQLHGIDIEYFCDQFSKDLGGKTIQQDKETFLHSDIYKNGKKLGLVKDVLDENILKQLIS